MGATPAMPQTPEVTVLYGDSDEAGVQEGQLEIFEEKDLFDREAVMKFINDAGLLSYNVRALRDQINLSLQISPTGLPVHRLHHYHHKEPLPPVSEAWQRCV